MPKRTDPKALELARLDKAAQETKNEAWTLFVSLYLDEALEVAAQQGHPDDIDYAAMLYLDPANAHRLLRQDGSYYAQVTYRLPEGGRRTMEPFTTHVNRELEKRGSSVRFRSVAGWSTSHLVRV